MFNIVIPAYLLPFLLYGERDGITEQEAEATAQFLEKYAQLLPLPLSAYCIPKDGQQTEFHPFNDITNEGAECYKFEVPAGKEARQ